LAILIAAYDLARAKLPRLWRAYSHRLVNPILFVIDRMHDGLIDDYVAWIVVGLALFSLSSIAISS
jgi:hypothetical protein